jgi:lysophospholipase L1-like esterase
MRRTPNASRTLGRLGGGEAFGLRGIAALWLGSVGTAVLKKMCPQFIDCFLTCNKSTLSILHQMKIHPRITFGFLAAIAACQLAAGQTITPNANDPALAKFHPLPSPPVSGLLLKKGDRLAICGDSITEQRMYSRIIEDYLTMCAPELQIAVRQYGWSGETASGFLGRMTNDCLRFKPTVATTCYGMNDHGYRPYEDRIGQTYREKSLAILEAFKANGVRVVQASPGCVGKMPAWVKTANGTVEDLNLSLCQLRNIGIELAQQEQDRFADVFWPMLSAGVAARAAYGTNFAIAGKDGVHPGWSGHTVMAFAFLESLGLSGDIGSLAVDLRQSSMTASSGHEVLLAKDGEFQIRSSRYPFCACEPADMATASYPVCGHDSVESDNSIRSALNLVPFNQTLNRLMLVATGGAAKSYKVTWGDEAKSFTAAELAHGVNLAAEFPANPFGAAFARVDAAVAVKQAYETKQIKQEFRSAEAKSDMEAVAVRTEKEREPLAAAIKNAFVPVTHMMKIVAE